MKKLLFAIISIALCIISCKPETTDGFPEHDGYRIYAVDNTGWSSIALYMYGTKNDLGGAWPGIRPKGKTKVNGKEYVYFEIGQDQAYGCTESLIFNNTSGAQIKKEPSLKFTEKADYFFTVTSTEATEFDGGSTLTVKIDTGPVTASANKLTEIDVPQADVYRIYQANLKLYASPRFDNLKARIPTIKALGTDILYLMPVYQEGSTKSVGSPYCVKDFRAVNSSYGSVESLKSLVDAAHDAGMKVMFDWVANHTSWDCEWTSTHKDWYKCDASGNIVYPTADGNWTDVAQLDYSSTALRAEMTDCMLYWVKTLGIDGYRCDYAHGPDGRKTGDFDAFWKSAITALRAEKPGFIMLAESDYDKMFDDGFDMNYSRPARSKLVSAFAAGDASGLANTLISEIRKAPEGCSKLMFETNHDEASANSPVKEFGDAIIPAFALLRALPVSTLFYGSQEIGWNQPIDFCKYATSFNWNSNPSLTESFADALKRVDAMKRGSRLTFYAAGPVLILVYADGGTFAVNTGSREATAILPGGAEVKLGAYEFSLL